MNRPVYIDNHATTPMDPRVLDAMLPFMREAFGNASSNHCFGRTAREAVEKARVQVAGLVGADDGEIVFTSGATESNNLAIKGIAMGVDSGRRHIVSVVTEHKAVLDPLARLKSQGFDVTLLPVDRLGMICADQVAAAIRQDTVLVSVMLANNEIGVIQPIRDIAEVCWERGISFHTDASQAVGKIPVCFHELGVSAASFTAHKLYGPKGVGALYIRRQRPRLKIIPMMDGGGHEGTLRSGTLNVPGIVGFGAACEIAKLEMKEESARIASLRDHLRQRIMSEVSGVTENGDPAHKLPGNLNLSFDSIEGESLLIGMDDVAVSSGSACTSGSYAPSHVLKALGLPDNLARSALRFGIGRCNTLKEIDYAADKVRKAVAELRAIAARPPSMSE